MAVHPNSLANLQSGSNPAYAHPKKRRHITVTDPGWQKAKAIAKEQFGLSFSELVEQIGRGNIKLSK